MRFRSKPCRAILDPVDFPFSEADVYAAYHRVESIRDAKRIARNVADGVRDQLWSERSAAAARERGSTDPYEINAFVVGVPGNLFPMLALVSQKLRRRVDHVRKRQRDKLHRNTLLTETFVSLGAWIDPAPTNIVDAVEARYAEEDAAWENGLAILERELNAADWRVNGRADR